MAGNTGFTRFAKWASRFTGRPISFNMAVTVIVVWLVTGPVFGFSDTWQLVINTGTTIITFLMVFVIQSAQNRDGRAVQLKLDELLRALNEARDEFRGAEKLTMQELDDLEKDDVHS